jgi:hypothetical protein
MAEDAEEIAQVGLGVEAVELARSEQREEVGGGLGVVIAADEEPSLATDGDAAELALACVVVYFESAVVEEAAERFALAHGVTEGRAQKTALVLTTA